MRPGHRVPTVLTLVTLIGSALLGAAAPATATPPGGPPSSAAAARGISAAVDTACAGPSRSGTCGLESSTTQDLGGGVTEYDYLLRVGPGTYDRIGLHRVVGRSVGRHAVFMVPGDLWGFDAAFAGRTGAAERQPAVASSLARAGVDVWGIDLRWTLVPAGVNARRSRIMAAWGFATMLADMRLATTVERAARQASGPDGGRTALLGWSRGGALGYAYAAMESQLAPADRNVSAFVPVDTLAVYAPTDRAYGNAECGYYDSTLRAIAAGQNAVGLSSYATVGQAARTAPDAASTVITGYTNRQAALAYGGVSGAFNPWYHFLAETLDGNGVPASADYTPEQRWFGLLGQTSAWESLPLFADGAAMWCAAAHSPFSAHVRDIAVPLLYIGAAGGFGTTGDYSTTRVASTDVSTLLIRLRPVGDEVHDFGHVDLWQGSNAAQLVWRPLATWLLEH